MQIQQSPYMTFPLSSFAGEGAALSERSEPRAAGGVVRFGLSGRFVMQMDHVFSWVQKNRTREMLLEDFIGMAFLRTAIDLVRPYIYKKTDLNKTPKLNPAAARERFFRETFSIITDNVFCMVCQ